jgi:hypothetical protein
MVILLKPRFMIFPERLDNATLTPSETGSSIRVFFAKACGSLKSTIRTTDSFAWQIETLYQMACTYLRRGVNRVSIRLE